MKNELSIEQIGRRLAFGLKGVLIHDLRDDYGYEDWIEDVEIFNKGTIWTYAGYADKDLNLPMGEGDFSGFLILALEHPSNPF